MRLRYLYLPGLPPLQEIEIRFGYEPVLGRACALHFVVGVNGSGKSRLLRALAEIFLCMDRGVAIPFDVTLVYDLGPGEAYPEDEFMSEADKARAQLHHTIYLHRRESAQTLLIDFDYIPPPAQPGEDHDWMAFASQDWEHVPLPNYRMRQIYQGNNLPSFVLPKVLLAYTSGAVGEWEALFAPRRSEAEDILMTTFNNVDVKEAREQERPPDWDSLRETNELQRQQAALYPSPELYPSATLYPSGEETRDTRLEEETGGVSSMGIFVPPKALKLAICAVVLKEAVREFSTITTIEDERNFLERIQLLQSEGRRMTGVRGLLNEIGWLWPVTIGLRILFRPDLLNNIQIQQLLGLYEASTTVIREPEPGKFRHLYFDLRSPARDGNGMTIEALIRALTPPGNDSAAAFDLFQQLLLLQQQGILEDITIALRKHGVDDLILYEELSDGEQVFLGRMAFFYLLYRERTREDNDRTNNEFGTEDALILLDEPETHFNDYWKREMVDIIDSSLRNDPIEVLLSTHSSIALTDAFDTEIVLLAKRVSDGSISVGRISTRSFGASPVEVMRDFFQTPEIVGQRAAEFLDLMLMIARYPKVVQDIWKIDLQGEKAQESEAFEELHRLILQETPYAFNRDEAPESRIDTLLWRLLRSVLRYTQQSKNKTEITMIDAIDALYKRLGPGYYQFEFHRRLQALRRDTNATSN